MREELLSSLLDFGNKGHGRKYGYPGDAGISGSTSVMH